jgi:hypothetical protein
MKLTRFFDAVITTGTSEMRIVIQAFKLTTFAQVKTAFEDLDNRTLPPGGNSAATNPSAGAVNFVGSPGASKRNKRNKKEAAQLFHLRRSLASGMEVPPQGCRPTVRDQLVQVEFRSALQ